MAYRPCFKPGDRVMARCTDCREDREYCGNAMAADSRQGKVFTYVDDGLLLTERIRIVTLRGEDRGLFSAYRDCLMAAQ